MKLWVDDLRPAPLDFIPRIESSSEAIKWLEWAKNTGRTVEVMSLDHDLGGDDTTRPIVLWMCENAFWPNEVRVHSMNVVGREWLEGMIRRYKP